MARLVLTSLGSWGDLFPFLAMGRALRDAGIDVAVGASPAYRSMIEAEGLEAVPLGCPIDLESYAEHPEILSSRMDGLVGLRAVLDTFLFPQIDQLVADTRRAISGADLLLTHPALVPAFLAAEADGVPVATVSASLGFLPSRYLSPSGRRVLPGRLGHLPNRITWTLAARALGDAFDAEVNRARRQLGLQERARAFLAPMQPPTPAILLVSPIFAGHPPDWPAEVTVAGFPRTHRLPTWSTPSKLRNFLDASVAPVLVTLGSSSSLDAGDFYTAATRAIRKLGRRALVVTGPSVHGDVPESNGDVLRLDYAPYDLVGQSCAAVVNHGGIGSLASFLACGKPQLLIPRAFDQRANARRAVRLGVARALPWGRASEARIGRELDTLLSRPDYASRAAVVAGQISQEDGIAAAVEAVCHVLGTRPPHPKAGT